MGAGCVCVPFVWRFLPAGDGGTRSAGKRCGEPTPGTVRVRAEERRLPLRSSALSVLNKGCPAGLGGLLRDRRRMSPDPLPPSARPRAISLPLPHHSPAVAAAPAQNKGLRGSASAPSPRSPAAARPPRPNGHQRLPAAVEKTATPARSASLRG